MKRIFVIICLIMALVGCTNVHKVRQGHVVEKECIPAHNTPYYNLCLKAMMLRHVPEQYFIWLADSVDTCRIQINKSMYDTIRISSYLRLD